MDFGRFLKRGQARRMAVMCQPWFYLRLVAYSFFRLSEGHRVNKETSCLRHICLRAGWILSLEPERFENRLASGRNSPDGGLGSRHTLKLLAVSIVLDRSVLLSSKSLIRSRQSCELESGVPSPASCLCEQILIEISQCITGVTSLCGRALEHILQVMTMIGIETAQSRQALGRLPLPP